MPAKQRKADPRYLKVVAVAKHLADYEKVDTLATDRLAFDEYYWPINGVHACGNDLFLNAMASY